MCGKIYSCCVMKLILLFKKILWKMKMQVFRIRILLLKMKPKLKSLIKTKKSLPHLLKTSLGNGELKKTSPWTTLLEKYQREFLLTLNLRFYAITWLLFLRLNQKNIDEALYDEHWLMAMHEELNEFNRNGVWDLVPKPASHKSIGTKWVFQNKLDGSCIIVRNKPKLVAKEYNQEEGIDYDETYAPVARSEAIRLLLAFACIMDFRLF